jgi:transposase InsO family protein
MTLEDKVHAFRLHALQRADDLRNVSAACKELGISRTVFYRWKRRFKCYGPDSLHPRRRAARRGRPPSLSLQDEHAVVAIALAYPGSGPHQYAARLRAAGRDLAPSTVYRALRRMGLRTRYERLLVLEHHSAKRAGLLTERTRRELERARRRRRHVQAKQPGDLVSVDTFYIGKLKGVGKVWQITACDAACSYASARIAPANTGEHAAAFLREVLVPVYRQAGWPLKRVLTDRGSEFKAEFDNACDELGIRHTRTKPRHAWTNGFVERLQGTILHEHWRVAFRRRYFTSRRQIEKSLLEYLAFYNDERPHLG